MNARQRWRALTPDRRDYVLIYAWGVLWSTWFLVFTPTTLTTYIDRLAAVTVAVPGIVGGTTAVLAVLNKDHLLLERLAVRVLIIAPVGYSFLQLAAVLIDLVTTGATQRSHLMLLGLWPLLFLRKRSRQLRRMVQEAKEAPLDSESSK